MQTASAQTDAVSLSDIVGLTGKVRDQNNKAVAGASVAMKDSAGNAYATTTNGSGGSRTRRRAGRAIGSAQTSRPACHPTCWPTVRTSVRPSSS